VPNGIGCWRRYASMRGERLLAGGEEETLRRQHASYFLTFEDKLDPERIRPTRWSAVFAAAGYNVLGRVEREQDNLRIALRWLIDSHAGEHAARLADALFQIDQIRGLTAEGRIWLRDLLTRPRWPKSARRESRSWRSWG
jgi:predicted ATPase